MCTELPPQPPVAAATTRQVTGGHVSRRTALFAAAGLATSTALTVSGVVPAAADPRSHTPRHGRIDLTYILGEEFPAYTPGEEAIRQPATTIPADGYYMQRWELYEHTGTHVDAPAHFNANGRYASELTPDELMVPAVGHRHLPPRRRRSRHGRLRRRSPGPRTSSRPHRGPGRGAHVLRMGGQGR